MYTLSSLVGMHAFLLLVCEFTYPGMKEVAREESILSLKPTVRHTSCAVLLLPSSKCVRCLNCESHRHTLHSQVYRMENSEIVDRTAPDSHVNYRFLRTPEKDA